MNCFKKKVELKRKSEVSLTANKILMFFFIALSYSKLFTTSFEEKSFISWMRSTNNFYTGDEYHIRFGIYLANS